MRIFVLLFVANVIISSSAYDVVVKNEGGIEEFHRFAKKQNLLQIETPTPSTNQLNGWELMSKSSSVANALSVIDDETIPQPEIELKLIFKRKKRNR